MEPDLDIVEPLSSLIPLFPTAVSIKSGPRLSSRVDLRLSSRVAPACPPEWHPASPPEWPLALPSGLPLVFPSGPACPPEWLPLVTLKFLFAVGGHCVSVTFVLAGDEPDLDVVAPLKN